MPEEKFTGQRFIKLKKDEEKTLRFFSNGIRYCQLIGPLEGDQHIRINYGGDKAAENDRSYKYDAMMGSFEVTDDTPYETLSMLANVDITVQLINPRSCF